MHPKDTKKELGHPSSFPPSILGTPHNKLAAIASVSKFDPLPESLIANLGIPEKLFNIGCGPFPCLSTDPIEGVGKLSEHLAASAKNPAQNPISEKLLSEMPKFGIHLFRDGSDFFCTLIDKSRGVVVFDIVMPLASGLREERPEAWAGFEKALDNALDIALETRKAGGESQRLVVMVRGRMLFVPAESC